MLSYDVETLLIFFRRLSKELLYYCPVQRAHFEIFLLGDEVKIAAIPRRRFSLFSICQRELLAKYLEEKFC